MVMRTPAPVQDCSRMDSSKGHDGQALCATFVFPHLPKRPGALGVIGVSGSKAFRDVATRIRTLICPVEESECMEILNHSGSAHTTEAYLRAVDVKILQQLVAVNEGIEAVKWLLEEKSTLTSRCSSLASSQYSLAGSQTASRRGSWDSLQDPPDKLDSISIGSYLDTLADDMDEYSQNAAELPRALARAEQDWGRMDPERGFTKQEKGRAEHEWPHADLSPDRSCPDLQRFAKEPQVANGYSGKEPKSGPGERLGKGNMGGKARKAEANLENCKLNSELHLEYDPHWLWLQSQDDVTFL
ncbi:leucine rich adaptor protein 1 isoform X1 [Numida meleagris]|uniref:leucine rich adaptor protein 1 isoform X1 n=1 Tax=Numida meleagris TaxID=8996 RepID=UPI000B3D9FFA|nr:leucine rich adaptor protein 1 isoform X1 [Numida meleagris]